MHYQVGYQIIFVYSTYTYVEVYTCTYLTYTYTIHLNRWADNISEYKHFKILRKKPCIGHNL